MNGHEAGGEPPPPADGAEEKPVREDDIAVGIDDPPVKKKPAGPAKTKK